MTSRDRSLFMRRGGPEEIEGGPPILYMEKEGGPPTLYMEKEGGPPILYMKIL